MTARRIDIAPLKSELLLRAQKLMSRLDVRDAFGQEGRTQLHDVMSLAAQADLVLEVKANLAYRAGKSRDTWGRLCGSDTVADLVNHDITEIDTLARTHLQAVSPEADLSIKEQFSLQAVTLYLGYLYWHQTANKGGNQYGQRR